MCLFMVLLSSSLLFTIPSVTKTPLANNIKEYANVNEIIQVDEFGLIKSPFQVQYEKDKAERERIRAEKLKQAEQNIVEENNKEWQTFVVTFYTGLDEENSIHGAVNCLSQPLERGMIASNVLKLGTKIYLERDYGERVVSDTGGGNFNTPNRIDLFVAQRDGENETQWKHRANSYGIQYIRGYIIK